MLRKKIILQNKEFEYKIRKSKRARRMRVTVYCNGDLTLTLPKYFPEVLGEKFLRQKSQWILEKIGYFKLRKTNNRLLSCRNKKDYLKNKSVALELAQKRILHFNEIYGVTLRKISIKNQKTRWGSCSSQGNLNFNYKIIYLPQRLADYIIVHELCHLREFNHSSRFWKLVALSFPDYRNLAIELRRI